MQTFLPYENFYNSAVCLDNKRLNKQIVEGVQILQCLMGRGSIIWRKHPVVKMWFGYEQSLYQYITECYMEWVTRLMCGKRGGSPNHKSYNWMRDNRYEIFKYSKKKPKFLGNYNFHNSHRSALLFKNPDWYSQFNWDVEPKIEYIYPTL